jgi:hypothetical protein
MLLLPALLLALPEAGKANDAADHLVTIFITELLLMLLLGACLAS